MIPTIKLPATAENENPFGLRDDIEEALARDDDFPQFQRKSFVDAGDNAAQNATVLVTQTNESWVNTKWRPAMSWVYMVTCITDFIIFPVLWSILQLSERGVVTDQWQPLTLQGAGLFHLAFGAILGIATYGRSQEKMATLNQTSQPTPPKM